MPTRPHPSLPASLCAELAKLSDQQVLILLGEIAEPSIYSPFATEEDFDEAMSPVREAYRGAYDELLSIAQWEQAA